MHMLIRQIDLELTFSFVSLLLPSFLPSLLPTSQSAVSADGLAQVHVKPLQTKPGGIVTVTVNFVADNLDTYRRLGGFENLYSGVR